MCRDLLYKIKDAIKSWHSEEIGSPIRQASCTPLTTPLCSSPALSRRNQVVINILVCISLFSFTHACLFVWLAQVLLFITRRAVKKKSTRGKLCPTKMPEVLIIFYGTWLGLFYHEKNIKPVNWMRKIFQWRTFSVLVLINGSKCDLRTHRSIRSCIHIVNWFIKKKTFSFLY